MTLPPRTILLHEHVTGGGWPHPDLPQPLGAEALAMLQAVAGDFRAWGDFPVAVTRDRRLAHVAAPADRIVVLDGEDYPTNLVALAKECCAALVVAPESGGTLEHLTRLMEGAGVPLLCCRSAAVAVAADKWECYQRFRRAGLPTPTTVRTDRAAAAAAAERLGYPVVVKPVTGAGCDGVCFVPRRDLLDAALDQTAVRAQPSILVQKYVAGAAASVSLLVAGGAAVVLGLNEQTVTPGIPFEYQGGVARAGPAGRGSAADLAKRAASLIPGLQGYVGVDVVLGERCSWLIEINARLTTSYVGLRRAVDGNLAAAIWRACREKILPEALPAGEAVAFRKDGYVAE